MAYEDEDKPSLYRQVYVLTAIIALVLWVFIDEAMTKIMRKLKRATRKR